MRQEISLLTFMTSPFSFVYCDINRVVFIYVHTKIFIVSLSSKCEDFRIAR